MVRYLSKQMNTTVPHINFCYFSPVASFKKPHACLITILFEIPNLDFSSAKEWGLEIWGLMETCHKILNYEGGGCIQISEQCQFASSGIIYYTDELISWKSVCKPNNLLEYLYNLLFLR